MEKLLEFVRRLAEDDSEGSMALKVPCQLFCFPLTQVLSARLTSANVPVRSSRCCGSWLMRAMCRRRLSALVSRAWWTPIRRGQVTNPPPSPLSSPGRSQVACQDSRLQLHQRQGARARGVFPAPRAVGGVVSVRTLLILHPPHPTPLRPLQKWMVACIGDLRKGTWTVPALQHLRSISELFISDTRRYPYTSPTKSRQEVCCGL